MGNVYIHAEFMPLESERLVSTLLWLDGFCSLLSLIMPCYLGNGQEMEGGHARQTLLLINELSGRNGTLVHSSTGNAVNLE